MMKLLKIVMQIVLLFAFSYIGSVVQDLFQLTIPGSIIGLILLLICLFFRIIPVSFINHGAGALLAILPLLFIPAMIGIMNYPSLLSLDGLFLLVVIVLSSIITLIMSGVIGQYFEKHSRKRKEKNKCNTHYTQSL